MIHDKDIPQAHIRPRLAELRVMVKSGAILYALTGDRTLYDRQCAEAMRLLGEALVADAKRLGVADATMHKSWGLYSDRAYKCRHRSGTCACMPRSSAWSEPSAGSGWPVVWKIAELWGVEGCGNGFNNQVYLDKPFRALLEQTR